MKSITSTLAALLFFFSLHAQESYNLIPQPKNLQPQQGVFVMKKGMSVSVKNELFSPVAELLVGQANKVASLGLSLNKGKSGAISFHMNPSIAKEAYVLKVASKKIEIEASTGAGAFYALQTLMQLMPPAMSGDVTAATSISIPNCTIEDAPRFGYRGLMLDVGRYFFSVEDIKRFMDVMAMYKLNTFHWHLTEDQGWRVEIKKYPLLTQISSVRKESMLGHYRDRKYDGKPHGGFYTQELS